MNYFIIGNALLYLGAMIFAIEKAQYTWAFVWLCYAASCAALAVLESK